MTRPEHCTDRGAAAVEFALIVPMLFLLIFGIVDFGRAYQAKVELAHAAREGARKYSLTQDSSEASLAARRAATTLEDSDPAAAPHKVTVTPTGCEDTGDFGDEATVRASIQFSYLTPLPGLVAALFPGDALENPITLSEDGVMQCGG